MGIDLAFDDRIMKWEGKETCELDTGSEDFVKNWTNRAEIVSENGIKVLGGTVIVTTPQTQGRVVGKVFKTPDMFLLSRISHQYLTTIRNKFHLSCLLHTTRSRRLVLILMEHVKYPFTFANKSFYHLSALKKKEVVRGRQWGYGLQSCHCL